jgi:DNA-binding transcriptional regulator YbjK
MSTAAPRKVVPAKDSPNLPDRPYYVYSFDVSSVRERVLYAAITLLGTEGLRALTHSRIDAKAGVPKGSTSNYFRTRAAVLEGVVDWMYAIERPSVRAAYSPDTREEFARALTDLFEQMTGPGRVMTTARLVLLMEASHDTVVRDALARGRTGMEEMIIPAVRRLGAAEPEVAAHALSATFEGMFLQKLARHVDVEAGSILAKVVHAFVGEDSLGPAAGARVGR